MLEQLSMNTDSQSPVTLSAEAAKKIQLWLSIARANPGAHPEWGDLMLIEPSAPQESA